jgi:hypothetical protein
MPWTAFQKQASRARSIAESRMKVFNLSCTNQHTFEGWFGSEAVYQTQLADGLLECPFCKSHTITRLPSAPRLNMGKSAAPTQASTEVVASAPSSPQPPPQVTLQGLWMKAVQHVLTHTEDVGQQFAQEVRRMHYGETEHRPVRGQASENDKLDLQEEGIEVLSLPLPAYVNETLQ